MTSTKHDPAQTWFAKTLPPGSINYYATRFLPLTQQRTVAAIYALNETLFELNDSAIDPTVSQAKLHWWHEEMQRLNQGQPTHPITQCLVGIAPECLTAWLQAALALQSPVILNTTEDLTHYCHQRYGIREMAISLSLGFHTADDLSVAQRASEIIGTNALLQHALNTQQFEWIPHTLLRTADFSAQTYQAAPRASVSRLVDAFSPSLRAMLRRLGSVTLTPHNLVAARAVNLALAQYQQLRARPEKVSSLNRPCFNPLQLLWIAWRTKRQGIYYSLD